MNGVKPRSFQRLATTRVLGLYSPHGEAVSALSGGDGGGTGKKGVLL